ncbi:hypothetical protein GmHk_12G034700 [Glycine max]|nr:hypothetical protein GmHk_12G034700 [Glycine max]
MSNHKSTESAIKNLEIQVGQLAKQIAENSSGSFRANTEKNPKEECKVVMTRGKKAIMIEGEWRNVDEQEPIVEEEKEEEEDQLRENKINDEYDEFRQELEQRQWRRSLTRQVRVRGKLIKFDAETLNPFLETPVVLELGEHLTTYSRFHRTRSDPQELASKLFPDSLTFESLSLAINLAYIRKNCWYPNDPSITFPGTRKAWARGPSDTSAPSSSVPAPSTPAPPPPASASVPSGTSTQSTELLVSMLPSLHHGLCLVMQSIHDLAQHWPIMSMEAFMAQMAWPGVQPSPLGRVFEL